MAWKGNARSGKFNAKRTSIDGIVFASKREARRYAELKLLEKAGQIHSLKLQPRFGLFVVGGFVKDIVTEIGEYVGDFDYFDVRRDTRVIEDSKGFRTPLYLWKKKHFEAQYGIQIHEV